MSSNTNGPESRVRGKKNLPWNTNLRIGTLNGQGTGSIRFTGKPENGPEEVQVGRSGSAGNETGGAGNRSWRPQALPH